MSTDFIRKRRRLAAIRLLIAATLCHNSCGSNSHQSSNTRDSSSLDAVDDGVSSSLDIPNLRSLESVASEIRIGGDHAQQHTHVAKKYYERKQRRRKQHQRLNRELIVGGQAAPPGRFPYVVSLQLEKVLDETSENGAEVSDLHTCGGTLIAMDIVLTAGHCGYEEVLPVISGPGSVNQDGHVNFGEIPQQIFYGADVGAYNLTSGGSTVTGSGYREMDNMLFEKLVLHPEYTGFHSKTALQHDVMLVKLYGSSDQPTVRLHDPSKAIRFNDHRNPTDGEELVVTGWGDTDPAAGEVNAKLASVLHAATVSYVPNDECEDSKGYSDIQSSSPGKFGEGAYFEYEGTISDDMMCALGKTNQDACQGDSGGGLMRLGDDYKGAKDLQMGIVSWGLQCGDQDFPGVYARVGEHYDWIAKNVCELSDSPPSYFNCPMKPYPPGSVYDTIIDLTIVIGFDDYRSETAWLLESIPDFRNIAWRAFGTYKAKTSVDESNSISEVVTVHSGRWFMLSILDEFADGFCCTAGEGYFRVDSAEHEYPLVETTPGILWSPYALRRAFYVSDPSKPDPPDYVTIVVTLGLGADPGKLLLVAIENVGYEVLLLYEIRPFVMLADPRVGATGTAVYTREFRVPVFGVEFDRQRYNVIVYDDNEGNYASKASFEVYLGDTHQSNLIIAQSGNYGDKNNISRSFVLFKKPKDEMSFDSPANVIPTTSDLESAGTFHQASSLLWLALLVASLGK